MKTLLLPLILLLFSFQFGIAQCDFSGVYTEGFEDAGALDPCWTQSATDDIDWTVRTGSYYSNTGPSGAHSGDYYIFVRSSDAGYTNSAGKTASIISPEINITTLTSPFLEFYYHMYGDMDPDGSISVDISIDGGMSWANVWTKVGNQGNNWLSAHVDLSNYTGLVQFQITGTLSSGSYWNNLFGIDDFSIKENPACSVPSELNATNILPQGATFSWIENGTATQYDLEIGDKGFAPTGMPTNTNINNSFVWDVGASIHDYDYYVRANCGGTQSDWEGPYSFKTPGTCGSYKVELKDNNYYGGGNPNVDDPSVLSVYVNGVFFDSDAFIYSSEIIIPTNIDDVISFVYYEGSGGGGGPGGPGGNYSASDTEYFIYNPDGILIAEEGDNYAIPSSIGDPFSTPPTGIGACAACSDPAQQGTANMTTTDVDLTWVEVGSSTAWEIEWGLKGFTQGSGSTVSAPSNPLHLTNLTEDENYDWYIRADCGGGQYSGWTGPHSFLLTPPPVNDNCEAATSLTMNTPGNCDNSSAGTLKGATQSPQPLDDCWGTENNDVWFSFVATSTTHTMKILNIDGEYNLHTSLWEGNCPTLTYVNNTCRSGSQLYANLVIGTTYFLRVNTYAEDPSVATFNICIGEPGPPPANDNCAGAMPITVYDPGQCVNTILNLENATVDTEDLPSCDSYQNIGVWYTWTATSTAIAFTSVSGYPGLSVYEAGTCGALTKVGCLSYASGNISGLTIGNDYVFFIWSNSYFATVEFCIEKDQEFNNNCAAAIPLVINSDLSCDEVTSGTTEGATQSLPRHCGGPTFTIYDVWYSFVATASRHVVQVNSTPIDPFTETLESGYEVFSGSCGSLVTEHCQSHDGTSVVEDLTPGETYYVRVFSFSSYSRIEFDICISTPPPPPANDDCAGAISLVVNPDLVCNSITSGTVAGATDSPQSSGCSGTDDDDVWYKFTATSTSQKIEISNVSTGGLSGYGTIYYAVWEGDCTNGLMKKYGSCTYDKSSIVSTVIGQEYYIQAYSQYSSMVSKTFDICVSTPGPAPANDNCQGAYALTVNVDYNCTNQTAGTLENATPSETVESSCTGVKDDDVWFTFVATDSYHRIKVTKTGGSYADMYFSLWGGDCVGGLSLVAGSCAYQERIVSGLIAGNTYYVRIFSGSTQLETTTFDVCVSTPPSHPQNDECVDAFQLTMNTGLNCVSNTAGTIAYATASVPYSSACSGNMNDDVWFKFEATSTTHVVSLLNVSNGTNVDFSIWQGSCANGLTLVPGSCSYTNMQEIHGLTAGNTYYVRVFSYYQNYYTSTTFDICVGTIPLPPANDNCANASLYTDAFTMYGEGQCNGTPNVLDLEGATDDSGSDAPSCDNSANYGVWYTWTATSTGLKFDSGTGSPGLTVYEAGSCGSLVQVGCLDNKDGHIVSGLTIGNNYLLYIWDDTQYSTVDFCLEEFTPVANDICVNAMNLTMGASGSCPANMVTVDATNATDDGYFSCDTYDNFGVWFSFVATDDQVRIKYTAGTASASPGIALFSTCGGSIFAGNCQNNSATLDKLTGLVIGNTYKLIVWFDNTSQLGTFDICLEEPAPAPPNDLCSGAISLTMDQTACGANTITGISNLGTTDSGAGTPSCGSYNSDTQYGDLWYSVTIPTGSTSAKFDVSNIVGPNSLAGALYTGTCGSLTELGCAETNSNWPWDVTGIVTPGETYYLRIWDYNNNQGGTFDLCGYYDNVCPSASWLAVPSSATAMTSTASCEDGDWTHFYSGDRILLSLKLAGTGAVVPDNGVTLDANGATNAFWVDAVAGNFVHNTVGAAFMSRKWDVNPTTQPTSPVGVRFYFTGTEYNAVNTEIVAQGGTALTSYSQMRMYKVLNDSDPFAIGSLAVEDGQELAYGTTPSLDTWVYSSGFGANIAEFEVAGFSGGGGGGASGGIPLPIELTDFVGYQNGISNTLEWTSEMERNTQIHIVERSANGFDDFIEIGKVDAAGNSNSRILYNFEDEAPLKLGYYRITTVDFDGSYSVSDVISVTRDTRFSVISIQPNPAKDLINIKFDTDLEGEISIAILDMLGQVALQQNIQSIQGVNTQSINLEGLHSGTYFVKLNDGSKEITRRIIKVN